MPVEKFTMDDVDMEIMQIVQAASAPAGQTTAPLKKNILNAPRTGTARPQIQPIQKPEVTR